MSKPDNDPSIENEPQHSGRPARSDPSERTVDRKTARSTSPGSPDDLSEHSVFDEPDIFPGRPPQIIDQDWSCTQCGYNLRGLPTGHRCPECGRVSLYRPPPREAASYGSAYRRKHATVSPTRSWTWVILVSLVSGPAALMASVFLGAPLPFVALVFAPILGEALKIVALALLVDAKPFLIRSGVQIRAAAISSALAYAAGQAVVCSMMPTTAPTISLILWRWIAWPALHIVCASVAAAGLVSVWERAHRDARRPRMTGALRPLLQAVALHAGLNALLFFWVARGFVF